jgi:hypothetical protein
MNITDYLNSLDSRMAHWKAYSTVLILILVLNSSMGFTQTPKNLFAGVGVGGNYVINNNGYNSSVFGFGMNATAGKIFTENFAARLNLGYSLFFDHSDEVPLTNSYTDDVGSNVIFEDDPLKSFNTDILLMFGTSLKERTNMYLIGGIGMTLDSDSRNHSDFSAGAGFSHRLNDSGTTLNIEGLYNTAVGGNFPIKVYLLQWF